MRFPRLPALYPGKKRWKSPEQGNPLDPLVARGEVLKLSEEYLRARHPGSVVALLVALRKGRPGEVVTSRVLFDEMDVYFFEQKDPNRRTDRA